MINNPEYFEQLESKIRSLKNIDDLADMLNLSLKIQYGIDNNYITKKKILFFANHTQKDRYSQFLINKKSGGQRIINAPIKGLKTILRGLNLILQSLYEPNNVAFGFVSGKSIVDNARKHVNKKFVYNIDLKDFFHSFQYMQVKNMFLSSPFNLSGNNEDIAELLALLVTHPFQIDNEVKVVLPQGSPTSPTLSNILCKDLDNKLFEFSKKWNVVYSRYADDISFSSDINVYSNELFLNELENIIESENLIINKKKTRLQSTFYRQEVTGLVVNEKVNVRQSYIKKIRNWLYLCERYGYSKAQSIFKKDYLKDKGHIKNNIPELSEVLDGKLEYLKMVKGKNNSTYVKLKIRYDNLFLNKVILQRNYINTIISINEQDYEEEMQKNVRNLISALKMLGSESPTFGDVANMFLNITGKNLSEEDKKDTLSDIAYAYSNISGEKISPRQVRLAFDKYNTKSEVTEKEAKQAFKKEKKKKKKKNKKNKKVKVSKTATEEIDKEQVAKDVDNNSKKPINVVEMESIGYTSYAADTKLKEGIIIYDKYGNRFQIEKIEDGFIKVLNTVTGESTHLSGGELEGFFVPMTEEQIVEETASTGLKIKAEDGPKFGINEGKASPIASRMRYKAVKGRFKAVRLNNGTIVWKYVSTGELPELNDNQYVDVGRLVDPNKNIVGRTLKIKVVEPADWDKIKFNEDFEYTFRDWFESRVKALGLTPEEFMKTDEFIGNVPIVYTEMSGEETPLAYVYETDWYTVDTVKDPTKEKNELINRADPTPAHAAAIVKAKQEALEYRKKIVNGKLDKAVVSTNGEFPYILVPKYDENGKRIIPPTLAEIAPNAIMVAVSYSELKDINGKVIRGLEIENEDELRSAWQKSVEDMLLTEEEKRWLEEEASFEEQEKFYEEKLGLKAQVANEANSYIGNMGYLMPIRKNKEGKTVYRFFPTLTMNENGEYKAEEHVVETLKYIAAAKLAMKPTIREDEWNTSWKKRLGKYWVSKDKVEDFLLKVDKVNGPWNNSYKNWNYFYSQYVWFNRVKFLRDLDEKIKNNPEYKYLKKVKKVISSQNEIPYAAMFIEGIENFLKVNSQVGTKAMNNTPVKVSKNEKGEYQIEKVAESFREWTPHRYRTDVMSFKVGEEIEMVEPTLKEYKAAARAKLPRPQPKPVVKPIHSPAVQQKFVMTPIKSSEGKDKNLAETFTEKLKNTKYNIEERKKAIEEANKKNSEVFYNIPYL